MYLLLNQKYFLDADDGTDDDGENEHLTENGDADMEKRFDPFVPEVLYPIYSSFDFCTRIISGHPAVSIFFLVRKLHFIL